MTLLSWDIPLISFNGSLWDVLLRCSKWLLGAWLDSFTMILRCWLVIWVKWARPLVSMTLWSRVMFNWKAVSIHFMGRPTPLKVNGGNFGTLLPPRGATFTPFWGMVLQSLPASSSVVIHKFLRNSRSELRPAKVCPMHCQWDFLGDYLPLGRTSYPRSLIKVIAHDSRLGRTFWHLIHGSVTKTVGGVARRNKSGRRIIISMTDNNNVLCH